MLSRWPVLPPPFRLLRSYVYVTKSVATRSVPSLEVLDDLSALCQRDEPLWRWSMAVPAVVKARKERPTALSTPERDSGLSLHGRPPDYDVSVEFAATIALADDWFVAGFSWVGAHHEPPGRTSDPPHSGQRYGSLPVWLAT